MAAWEVLTRTRVARSTGSGRMSVLGRYRAEGIELTRERVIWIALHAFEGASERWECRLAGGRTLTDRELVAAVVQEMGGPAEDRDEMTTLGFWLGSTGFSFDCRGPAIELIECVPNGSMPGRLRKRRIGRAGLISVARQVLQIAVHTQTESPNRDEVQLSLL